MDGAASPEPTSVPARGARRRDSAGPAPAVMRPEAAPQRPRAPKPWERPVPKRRAKAADVIRHDTDITLEMAEQMIDEGIDIGGARSMIELASLWNSPPALGRPKEPPRLGARRPRRRANGEDGRRMAVVLFGGKPYTTGIALGEDEDPKQHKGAKLFLRLWKKDLAKATLGKLRAPNRTMREVFREILTDTDPGKTEDPALTGPYKRLLADCAQLEEHGTLADARFSELPGNIAQCYVLWRIQQQIKSQSASNPNPRLVDPATADGHIDSLFFVIRKFCDKYHLKERTFKRLKFRRKPPRWLSFWQLWKIIRYCRGYLLDESGRIVGRHGMAKKYACVLRYVLIYVYGGTRKNNIRELIWGMDQRVGHIDVRAGELQRQGPDARITNKARLPSDLIGSLRTLAPQWFAEDMAEHARLGKPTDRFVHVLHDEQGYQLSEGRIDALLAEACLAVGLRKVNAHSLKHTGVSLVSRANMPLPDIEEAFSTQLLTLVTTYRHLYGKWFTRQPKLFHPDDLNLLRLRRVALRDRDEIYGTAA